MSASWESLANDHILGIAPYEPGKPIEELERELGIHDVIKLASNENPLPPSDRVMKAMQDALGHINRYPDGSGHYLRQAIARRQGLTSDHIILGNGSNDLIELMARAFLRSGEEAVIPHPSFVVYPMIVQAVGGIRVVVTLKDQRLDLEAMARAITPMTKMVFIANPNNPTGTFVPGAALEEFLAGAPREVAVVVDEAYTEYLPREVRYDSIAWLKKYPNFILTRTFSKVYGLAGMRVGFGLMQPGVADLMNRVRQPFNVNSLALAAATAALGDAKFVAKSVKMNQTGMAALERAFKSLGIEYIPSYANFITFRLPRAGEVYQKLLRQGVIVRPIAGYGMPEHLRVTIGTPKENARFLKALEAALD